MGSKSSRNDRALQFSKNVQANIVVIGVRKAGMTSIMKRLVPNNELSDSPSTGNNVVTLTPNKGFVFTTWGLGFGHERPPLWRYHLKKADGLLLIIDSGNRRTLVAMKEEIASICSDDTVQHELPVVVLANKHDLKNAIASSDIADALELYNYPITWNVQCCSALTGEGLLEGVRKLIELVKHRRSGATKEESST